MHEFEIIKKYFANATTKNGVVVDIGDDAAVLTPTEGCELVFAADALIEGRHFDDTIAPFDLGHKSLAVNLSDIAAMGAKPRWFTLSIGLDIADEAWLSDFVKGMAQLANLHNCSLVGGDTVSSQQKMISISVIGEVEQGRAITRSGAQVGDWVFVGGPVGLAQNAWRHPDIATEEAKELFFRPQPQIELGQALVGYAHSCIDISDGLLAESRHIAQASGVEVNIDLKLLQPYIGTTLAKAELENAITGGEDYVLLFTISPNGWVEFKKSYNKLAEICVRIGYCKQGNDVIVRQGNEEFKVENEGYQHF